MGLGEVSEGDPRGAPTQVDILDRQTLPLDRLLARTPLDPVAVISLMRLLPRTASSLPIFPKTRDTPVMTPIGLKPPSGFKSCTGKTREMVVLKRPATSCQYHSSPRRPKAPSDMFPKSPG